MSPVFLILSIGKNEDQKINYQNLQQIVMKDVKIIN